MTFYPTEQTPYLPRMESMSSFENVWIRYYKRRTYKLIEDTTDTCVVSHYWTSHSSFLIVSTEPSVSATHLSLTGCQGRFPFLPMPRSGHTATIPFSLRDISTVELSSAACLVSTASRQQVTRAASSSSSSGLTAANVVTVLPSNGGSITITITKTVTIATKNHIYIPLWS